MQENSKDTQWAKDGGLFSSHVACCLKAIAWTQSSRGYTALSDHVAKPINILETLLGREASMCSIVLDQCGKVG